MKIIFSVLEYFYVRLNMNDLSYLVGYSSPTVSIHPNRTVTEGVDAHLTCHINGLFNVHETKVTWEHYINGSWNQFEGVFGRTLKLDSIEKSNMGSYRCIVTLFIFMKDIVKLTSTVGIVRVVGRFA